METVLITGGTGMIGSALSEMLQKEGYSVIILTRKSTSQQPATSSKHGNIKYAHWDVKKGTVDIDAIQQADHIIHLAGAGVMEKKWADAFKKEIIESRTKSIGLIIDALEKNSNKIKTVVSASATGWYKAHAPGAEQIKHTEDESPDDSFLGETCRLWEQSVEPVTALQKRLVKLRVGIVLSHEGGALKEFEMPLKFGIAAILGNGKQVVSWIHINDLCRAFIHALKNEQLAGSYNAVAPAPVTNRQLTLTFARKRNRRFYIPLPVPSFMIKLLLGGRSIEILKSNNVSCEKIRRSGFEFLFTTIDAALEDLCNKK